MGDQQTSNVLKAMRKPVSKRKKKSLKKSFNGSALFEWIKLLPETASYSVEMTVPGLDDSPQLIAQGSP